MTSLFAATTGSCNFDWPTPSATSAPTKQALIRNLILVFIGFASESSGVFIVIEHAAVYSLQEAQYTRRLFLIVFITKTYKLKAMGLLK